MREEAYQQARDNIAIKYGFKSWVAWYNMRTLPFPANIYKEVAFEFLRILKP